jgi:formate-nitrite transporter family protein
VVGVAAGLSISFSLLAQGVLYVHLPDAIWRPLVTGFGYSVGFLMVVLSRQQLFTENTITVVLPVMKQFSLANLGRLGRLWSIVFAANMTGTLFAALFCTFTPVLTPELRDGMLEISCHMMETTGAKCSSKASRPAF